MRRLWRGFAWGPPSHRRIAWVGLLAGLIVVALPVVIEVGGSGGQPLFLLTLVFVGIAESGWGIELAPVNWGTGVAWARCARWLSALIGLALSALTLAGQLAPLWFVAVVAIGALLLAFEMAPGGFANRPVDSSGR